MVGGIVCMRSSHFIPLFHYFVSFVPGVYKLYIVFTVRTYLVQLLLIVIYVEIETGKRYFPGLLGAVLNINSGQR